MFSGNSRDTTVTSYFYEHRIAYGVHRFSKKFAGKSYFSWTKLSNVEGISDHYSDLNVNVS
jgi:hypothetical protein